MGNKWTALVLAMVSGGAVTSTAGAAPIYHSPGYQGTTRLGSLFGGTYPPTTLGTGKYPSLFVDPAGTGQIVFARDGGASNADTISYCGLQRGRSGCGADNPIPNPGDPNDSTNHDFDGPVPLDIGNTLYIVDRRFPATFTTPAMTQSESNVFVWQQDAVTKQITGPGFIGDNEMGGGAVFYGGTANPSIGTISRTQTDGTWFQGAPAGQYTTDKALLGDPGHNQDYDGELAVDGTDPVAVFADLSGNVFIREWSGQGYVNDVSTWSTTSFKGYSPQIIGGPAGVFVLYDDSSISGGNIWLRRVVGGRLSGGPVKLSGDIADPSISEDYGGRIAYGYVAPWRDGVGVWVRTSTDGAHFSAPALTATAPSGHTIDALSVAATADGGGYTTYIKDGTGAEDVGQVQAEAFGTQQATHKPGLGTLPPGGIGSGILDQLATSTCDTASFGPVEIKLEAGCWFHETSQPTTDVSLGEIDLNGLQIIPDPGVKISIDPRQHTIDTTGSVSVKLKGNGIDITIWHGSLHVKLPLDIPDGTILFDFPELTPPDVAGFPIDGSVDVNLVKGGVEVPISLKLPGYFGGITGQATLTATLNGGLQLSSLQITIGDANFGGLELKGVHISYTLDGDKWTGSGELQIPAGGGALDLKLDVEFDHGDFQKGSFDVGLPYPGVPFDLNDTPPQLYLTHGGAGIGLNPPMLSGTLGFGIAPTYTGTGLHDYAFSLDGTLSASFGDPVTFTATATGFLQQIQVETGTLVYKFPDQVTFSGSTGFDLGVVSESGFLKAAIDPQHDVYAGQIGSKITIDLGKLGLLGSGVLDAGKIDLSGITIAVNQTGFALFVPPVSFFPEGLNIFYHWTDKVPTVLFGPDQTGQFTDGLPAAARDGRALAAGVTTFRVPKGAPSADIVVHGNGGPPAVVLTAPNGRQIVPAAPGTKHALAMAIGDRTSDTTYVGMIHPAAGRWTVQQQSGTQVAIAAVQYAIGEPPPAVHVHVAGRELHYRISPAPGMTVTFAEQASHLFHVLGHAKGAAGTIRFAPAFGPGGRRTILALIVNRGVPYRTLIVGSFIAPPPVRPAHPRRLRVHAGTRAFTITFSPGRGAVADLIRIVGTDGRHLQLILRANRHRLSVPAIGYRDGISVTVTGIGADGRHGPSARASARRRQ